MYYPCRIPNISFDCVFSQTSLSHANTFDEHVYCPLRQKLLILHANRDNCLYFTPEYVRRLNLILVHWQESNRKKPPTTVANKQHTQQHCSHQKGIPFSWGLVCRNVLKISKSQRLRRLIHMFQYVYTCIYIYRKIEEKDGISNEFSITIISSQFDGWSLH